MADEATPATGEEPQSPPDTEAEPQGTPPDPTGEQQVPADEPQNPDAFKKALDTERNARREAEKRAKELQTRVTEFEDVHKSDLEKTQEELGRVKPEAERLSQENVRLQVALEKGLPAELIGRLQGASKEELAADADQLLALTRPADPAAGSFDQGVRTPATRPEPEPGPGRIRAAIDASSK